MAYTNGFNSPESLTDHFDRHGALLGAKTELEYLHLADEFFGIPVPSGSVHLFECTRAKDGDKIRYDDQTKRFGVLSKDNVIRTFYVLTTAIRIYGSGLNYFRSECLK